MSAAVPARGAPRHRFARYGFSNSPVELISDELYQERLREKNNANRKLHLTDPEAAGKDIHEIKPVRFGGSPTDRTNKIYLDPKDHKKCTRYWNKLQNDIKIQLSK